ncbi:MAG: hypothetical protein H7144_09845 [Burkholderiales bacterium]|nr:hypothetical protein [Phycisphaerae bacterium]
MTGAVAVITVMMWMIDRDNAYWILPVVAIAWIVMIGVWVWLAGFFSKTGGEARGFSVMQEETPRDQTGSK